MTTTTARLAAVRSLAADLDFFAEQMIRNHEWGSVYDVTSDAAKMEELAAEISTAVADALESARA